MLECTYPGAGEFLDVPALTNVLPGWTGQAAINVKHWMGDHVYIVSEKLNGSISHKDGETKEMIVIKQTSCFNYQFDHHN